MTAFWLPGSSVIDLSGGRGYGPFNGRFLGVVAHVNQSVGSLANFFRNWPDVCPNFQVYLDGSIEQYLPLDWQPWCQSAGNQEYAAIESEGYNTDPWTAPQLDSISRILAAYRDQLGMTMLVTNQPGQPGLGWHGMGGVAWGNHPDCPGLPRRAQLMAALVGAATHYPSGGGTPEPQTPTAQLEEDDMADNADWYVITADPQGNKVTYVIDHALKSKLHLPDPAANDAIAALTAAMPTYNTAPPGTTGPGRGFVTVNWPWSLVNAIPDVK